MAARRVPTAERRARLGVRHHLAAAARTDDVVAVADRLVGYHATDPVTPFLSAAARAKTPHLDRLSAALYDDRSLVRMLCMRRTVFTVPTALLPVVAAASSDAVAGDERKKLIKLIELAAPRPDTGRWISELETKLLAALEARGEAIATDLSKDVPELAERMDMIVAGRSVGQFSMVSRLLLLLAAEGRIMRGRPRGTWVSSQYRWSTTERWLGGPIDRVDMATARTELARRWLWTFGPAPLTDLKWWTGWTLGQVRAAVANLDVTDVELDDGSTGVLLTDDLDPVSPPKPWVALLPGLDPTPMGWQSRAWFLGSHASELFDRTGNVGPTVWADGRIVGGWAQRADGQVVTRRLEEVGPAAEKRIAKAARDLERLLGDTRVTPRFRAPLERALVT